jgi:hypothetical protein
MKTILLTLSLILSNLIYSQIGVVTVEKHDKTVPLNMWFVSNEKDSKNQMFYMSEDGGEIGEVLANVLYDLGIEIDFPIGRDSVENPFWGTALENGFYVTVYLDYPTNEFKYNMITIVTQEQ